MRFHTSFKVEKVIVTGFLLVILVGAFLLWLSNNFIYDKHLAPVDALFTATSGVCVTGLAVVNISSSLGFLSQVILLMLIQIGGLGIMTGMMLLAIVSGRRVGIKGRIFFLGGLGVDGVEGAVKLFYTVIKYTLFFEGLGAALLFAGFLNDGACVSKALYYAVFHSISAFCNAGFSPCVDGLNSYKMSVIIPAAIMLLIVFGGIGFPAFAETADCIKNKRNLSAYPKIVLIFTGALIICGAVLILISDWNTAFKDMPVWAKAWNALFASVTTRTAGFDTVQPAAFSGLGKFLMILLMIIGASPASTGGGIKTTTFGVITLSVWNELHSCKQTVFMNRTVSASTEHRAMSIALLYVLTIFVSTVLMTIIEHMPFTALIFEVTSALGTVGLTLGITPHLSTAGKLVITLLMFWGRVGLYSMICALITADNEADVYYPVTYIPL